MDYLSREYGWKRIGSIEPEHILLRFLLIPDEDELESKAKTTLLKLILICIIYSPMWLPSFSN